MTIMVFSWWAGEPRLSLDFCGTFFIKFLPTIYFHLLIDNFQPLSMKNNTFSINRLTFFILSSNQPVLANPLMSSPLGKSGPLLEEADIQLSLLCIKSNCCWDYTHTKYMNQQKYKAYKLTTNYTTRPSKMDEQHRDY